MSDNAIPSSHMATRVQVRQVDGKPPPEAPRGSANRRRRSSLSECILKVDSWLRQRQRIFEYSAKPDCILRAQVAQLNNQVLLADGTVGRPGDPVIHLHLWSEQVLPIPSEGLSLAWGRHINHCLTQSLRELAQFLMNNPDFANIAIIRASMSIGSKRQSDALRRIIARHGFEAIPDLAPRSCSEYARWFGENILYWLLTVACNPAASRLNKFWRNRTWIYLSRKVLEGKHSLQARTRLEANCCTWSSLRTPFSAHSIGML
jgi:hypothetical protein